MVVHAFENKPGVLVVIQIVCTVVAFIFIFAAELAHLLKSKADWENYLTWSTIALVILFSIAGLTIAWWISIPEKKSQFAKLIAYSTLVIALIPLAAYGCKEWYWNQIQKRETEVRFLQYEQDVETRIKEKRSFIAQDGILFLAHVNYIGGYSNDKKFSAAKKLLEKMLAAEVLIPHLIVQELGPWQGQSVCENYKHKIANFYVENKGSHEIKLHEVEKELFKIIEKYCK